MTTFGSLRSRRPTRRAAPAALVAAIVALAVSGARAEEPSRSGQPPTDRIRALLRSRTDRASSASAVRELARLAAAEGNVRAAAALLQARFYFAENYLNGDDQVRANEESIRDGLAHLSKLAGAPLRTVEELDNSRDRIPRGAVPILFWTVVAFGRTIESMSVFSQMGAATRFRRVIERSIALDGGYFHGAAHGALALYLAQAPSLVGGDGKLALRHALRALEIGPRLADNHLHYAEVVMRVRGMDPDSVQALNRALDLPDDAIAELAPEQRAAKTRAHALLSGAPLD